jgi:PIN domain nuclease of toxin-antitoxin system
VLDASAFLAYLHDERGAEVVARLLASGTYISAANWAEVLSRESDLGVNSQELVSRLIKLNVLNVGIEVVPLTEQDAELIGQFRASARRYGLSLGDRACLALGKRLQLPVFTADRQWLALDELEVDVQSIR